MKNILYTIMGLRLDNVLTHTYKNVKSILFRIIYKTFSNTIKITAGPNEP